MTEPTGTSSPSAAHNSAMVPSASDSNSTSALSDSMTASTSPFFYLVPDLFDPFNQAAGLRIEAQIW